MGAWGYNVMDCDEAAGVYESFEAKMNEGIEKELIADLLIKESCYGLQSEVTNSDYFNSRLGLAQVCWEYGVLTPTMLNEVTHMVKKGEDYENWVDNEKDVIAERKELLNDFITMISTPCTEVEQNEKELKRYAITEKIEDLLRDLCNLDDVDTLTVTMPKSIKIVVNNFRECGGVAWEMNDNTNGFELVK